MYLQAFGVILSCFNVIDKVFLVLQRHPKSCEEEGLYRNIHKLKHSVMVNITNCQHAFEGIKQNK